MKRDFGLQVSRVWGFVVFRVLGYLVTGCGNLTV